MHAVLLKLQKEIPGFIQFLMGVTVVGSIGALIHMWLQSWRAVRALDALKMAWSGSTSGALSRDRRLGGLSIETAEQVRAACANLQGKPEDWWTAVDDHLERYTPAGTGADGWFLTAPLREILPEDETITAVYATDVHRSIPGIITGFGLLTTFVAILVALYPVTMGGGRVQGIGDLINGLSGKFLASVIALLLSIIFVLLERRYCTARVRRSYRALIKVGRGLFPRLTSTRILYDIEAESVKQSTSLSNISSDLVDRLTTAFNQEIVPSFGNAVSDGMALRLQEEFRPTMQRMSDTLDGLRSALERMQEHKEESIVGEMQKLMGGLQSSMAAALEQMGRRFSDALSGAARDEFSGLEKTLSGTAQVLGGMNDQFLGLQVAMRQLIERAEQSATNQAEAGREQIEAMTALMGGLMTRLQETADSNLRGVSDGLTLVVSDLNQKVGALSEKMITAIGDTAARAQESTNNLIERTGEWSESTMRRLEALLDSIEHRSDDFRQAGEILIREHGTLQETIRQNHLALREFASAATSVQTYSTALAGQGKALQSSEERNLQAIRMMQETVGHFGAMMQDQSLLIARCEAGVRGYVASLESLDQRLAAIFEAIHKGMQDYSTEAEKHYDTVVRAVDKTLPNLSQVLHAQVEGIADQLEELVTIFGEGVTRLNAAG